MSLFKRDKNLQLECSHYEDGRDIMTEYLKEIYFEKKSAAFIGSSLCIDHGGKSSFVSFKGCKDEEEKFWYSMIYVKFKGKNYYFFKDSVNCIIEYVDKYDQLVEVARLLLAGGVQREY